MSDQQLIALVFLQGIRLILRPLLEEDIPFLLRWINDPEVKKFLGNYLPMMEADQTDWLERVRKSKDTQIVLMIEVDGKPIGTMGIHGIDWKDRTATTGALIGEKEYWGKGYGTEAKMLLLNYAFNTLNLRKIKSRAFAFNERSIAYSTKCGYEVEARLKKETFREGKYHDEVLLAVFKKDWKPVWKKFSKKMNKNKKS